ncbi:hypothetical protein ACMFMG_001975 [Clarireedia jacksonii]
MSTVSDIFYVHERRQKLAILGLAVLTGALLGQVISDVIIESLGFSTTFGFAAVFYIIIIPLMYIFVPETTYSRKIFKRTYLGGKDAPLEVEIQEVEPEKTFVERLSAVVFSTCIYSSCRLYCNPN